MPEPHDSLIALTAQIVSAHVANNPVASEDLPPLIRGVYDALGRASTEATEVAKEPAVPIRSSIKADAVTCLECGSSFQMLKRHLGTEHHLTPQEYRAKWGLPSSYPVVSPNYAKTRSTLAKKIGLGRLGVPRRKGRRRKTA